MLMTHAPIVQRTTVCAIPVDCVNEEAALTAVGRLIDRGTPSAIFAMNPEKVMHCLKNSKLRHAIQNADLLIPDGIGIVMAARLLGGNRLARVPGCELMPALCGLAARRGLSVFLLGAAPGVAARAGAELTRRLPDLRIVGCEHGHDIEARTGDMVAAINSARPDFLFVALGSPRQELWIAENLPRLEVKVCQAVGGTFDVLAGDTKRAPRLFRMAHLEWFYRLASQPTRIRRQGALLSFSWLILKERVGRRPALRSAAE